MPYHRVITHHCDDRLDAAGTGEAFRGAPPRRNEPPTAMNRHPREGVQRTFRALHIRNYRLFWFGQLVSVTGTWMQSIGQAWLVLRLTNSPFALGLVTMIQFAPILALSLFGGVIADRFPKRQILLVTQSVMLLQAAVLAVLVSTGLVRVEYVYVLAAVLGLASAIDNPTRQAFVVELVGADDLPNAVALNSTQFNAARIVGPGLGGATIALVGIAGTFYINAVSYLGVIAALVMLSSDALYGVPERVRGQMIRQIGEGLRYALRTPDITVVVIMMGILGTFGYNFTVLLPLIAKYVLDAGPLGFGGLTSAMAVGSLVASVWIAYQGRASERMLFLGAAGFSLALVGVACSRWWPATVPLLVVLGLFSILFTATANTRLQLTAPAPLRGRVMSIYMLLFAGSTPIGSLIVGWLAQRQGVQLATAEMGAACVVGVVAALAYRRHAVRGIAAPAAVSLSPHDVTGTRAGRAA